MSFRPKELLKRVAETQDKMVQVATEPLRQLTGTLAQQLGLPEPPEPPKTADFVESLPDLPTPPTPQQLLPALPTQKSGNEAFSLKAVEEKKPETSFKMKVV